MAKAIVVLVIVILLIVFVTQNLDDVPVDFVFVTADFPLIWVLIVALAVVLLPLGDVGTRIALNGLVFMGALYALRGLAVFVFLASGSRSRPYSPERAGQSLPPCSSRRTVSSGPSPYTCMTVSPSVHM